MQRKTIGLLAALVAFGLLALAPATSSAQWLKETVGAETSIVANNKKFVAYGELGQVVKFSTSTINVECTEVTMTGAVHANHDEKANVHLTVEDVWFRGETTDGENPTQCKNSSGGVATVTIPAITNEGGTQHWCIMTTVATDKFMIEPRNCTGTGGEFTIIIHTGGMTCGFNFTANLEGTFTTATAAHEAATLTVNTAEFKKHIVAGQGALCPATAKLENLKLQLYTDVGETNKENGPYRDINNTKLPLFFTE
jgi:hypothetical protein